METYGKPQRRSYDGGVDVVINFTGGDTWVPSLRCLKRGGKLLVCGATAGYDPKEDLRYVWSFELQIVGSNSFYDDDLAALMALIAAGKIKPVIDKVLPLERGARRLAPDRGPRSDRQSGGDAVTLCHHPPTGPARSGRPDGRLHRMIQYSPARRRLLDAPPARGMTA